MSADALLAFERELGGQLERHAPLALDGVAIGASLRPADGEALQEGVRGLGRHGLAAVVCGARGHLDLGNPPRRADVWLDVAQLSGVDEFEPREGVCHARAGTPLGELRARLLPAGWELPIDAPDASTLGGVLAAGVLGPRSLCFGAPRDAVLGLEVVLGSGERTRCGGRVVKNVTGYDLAKLYVGSLGTLAVIEGAWLRLRPRPETTRVLAFAARELEHGFALALAASRLAHARACVLRGDAERGYECGVELAGDENGVAHDAQSLRADEVAPDRLAEAASWTSANGAGDLVVRLSALPSDLATAAAALASAGAELAIHPGLRLLYARWRGAAGDPEASAGRLAAVDTAARAASARARIERAPPEVKRRRDVFGAALPEVRLTRALKSRFDPRQTLAPGRAAGCT